MEKAEVAGRAVQAWAAAITAVVICSLYVAWVWSEHGEEIRRAYNSAADWARGEELRRLRRMWDAGDRWEAT